MRPHIVSHFLICLCVIHYSGGQSVTWYEPLPVETVSSSTTDLPPAKMKVFEGYPASLSWNFSLTSLTLFLGTVRFDTVTLGLGGPGGSGANVDDAFKDRFNLTWISQRLTLVIFNVTASYDASNGAFECELGTNKGSWSRHIRLNIIERTRIVGVTTDKDVCEDTKVTLSCNATGKPEPNITWTRVWGNGTDSGALQSKDGYFVMDNIGRGFNGIYRCTAFNGVGEPVNQTVKVIVRCPPKITHIMNDKIVNETDKVTLNCQADGYPSPRIRWIFVSNNSFVPGTFRITGKQEEGFYRCIADNGVGNPSIREVYITVNHYRPLNTTLIVNTGDNAVIVNQTFNITCSAQANPPATYGIFRDDGTNVGSNSVTSMSVTEVGGNNAVSFTCKTSNAYGDGPTAKITVEVYSPPVINSKTSCETFVERGKPKTLRCTPTGHPTPNITWTKLGITHDSDGISLTITPEESDRHSYECKADNGIGIPATRTFVVVVESEFFN
ncbi:MAM domain-containing glycosylphosphatidylinositol anchor protein 2-like [Stylophora pistillata]|uniref:MAM domain-containing glycosylphosphatidylinositol anchor protein 2-like n=1 Tax=Stylophora pistillata TaxID=50429 RepID=UPI000C03ADCB|nr:MAM domain-containing glycosylphosphatidylinositol anchor protein 2-like [Stylophora pistillata]